MQTVTLNIPDAFYTQLHRAAAQTSRTVEAELLDVLFGAFSLSAELAPELESEIASLAVLDDKSLWSAARNRTSREEAAELEGLHSRNDLTDVEKSRKAMLMRQYERNMLVRAKAAALLKERGHDVSALLGAA